MPDRDQHSIGLLIMAGVGAGALTGALPGLLLARRPRTASRGVIAGRRSSRFGGFITRARSG